MANERRLIEVSDEHIKEILTPFPYYPDEIWKFIAMAKRFPTVNAVEVVRCGECEYLEMDGKAPFTYLICTGHEFVFRVEPDGFCSCGKRRDETNG